MPRIVAAGNTLVPAILALEAMGFSLTLYERSGHPACLAHRGDEEYVADDPISVLGLVRLVELRGWDWQVADLEIDRVLQQYRLA